MKAEQTIDLDNPKDAKFFLRSVKFGGKHIDEIELADGRILKLEDMTDEQLVKYAKDIYFDFCGGAEGETGTIELDEPAEIH